MPWGNRSILLERCGHPLCALLMGAPCLLTKQRQLRVRTSLSYEDQLTSWGRGCVLERRGGGIHFFSYVKGFCVFPQRTEVGLTGKSYKESNFHLE